MADPRPNTPGAVPLAAVVPFLAPFRLHFLRRITRELPNFRLSTLVTQNPRENPWEYESLPEIGLMHFGKQTPWQHSSSVRKAWPADWKAGGRICRWLDESGAKAVFLVGYAYPSHARVIMHCHRRGVPVMLWGDSNVLGDTSRGLRRAAKKCVFPRLLKRCAAVLPCGSAGKLFFARYGVPESKMHLSPAEPDYELIERADPALVRAVGEKHGLDPARRRFMCCARLVRLKRFDAAIDAFATIAGERPEWDLLIVGDGEMRGEWEARVPAALRTRVKWTGFVHDPAEAGALFCWGHALVHPGDYEAWGLIIPEAASAGQALICSTVVGAAADMLKDGENGRFVPPGDAGAVAAAMLEVSAAGTIERMRGASRGIIAEWRRMADPIAGFRAALAASDVPGV